jgi:hypothetical protein
MAHLTQTRHFIQGTYEYTHLYLLHSDLLITKAKYLVRGQDPVPIYHNRCLWNKKSTGKQTVVKK